MWNFDVPTLFCFELKGNLNSITYRVSLIGRKIKLIENIIYKRKLFQD